MMSFRIPCARGETCFGTNPIQPFMIHKKRTGPNKPQPITMRLTGGMDTDHAPCKMGGYVAAQITWLQHEIGQATNSKRQKKERARRAQLREQREHERRNPRLALEGHVETSKPAPFDDSAL